MRLMSKVVDRIKQRDATEWAFNIKKAGATGLFVNEGD
jgi:hypothetical protein